VIARLRGELLEIEAGRLVVDAGGVGYEVLVPETLVGRLPELGSAVDLVIRQVFREDGVTLYGFAEPFERRLFDLLTEVKGCGPKTGLAVLGELGADGAATAIATQDAKSLCRASGVGPRLAERIILELKDKVQQEALGRKIGLSQAARAVVQTASQADELVDALLALGYKRIEAEQAADLAREQAPTVEEQLKIALRSLRK
jgi:Holliday junction DNA helicase RuvA